MLIGVVVAGILWVRPTTLLFNYLHLMCVYVFKQAEARGQPQVSFLSFDMESLICPGTHQFD